MPYNIIQAGSSLQFMDSTGGLTTLTLPSGVQLATDRQPRFAIIGRYVVVVNTPSRPLTVDGTGTVRPLAPTAPMNAPTVAAGGAGTLSGTYDGIRYTYIIKDVAGNVISESGMSPPASSVTVTNQLITVSNIGISPDAQISARRFYRPTDDGAVLFKWYDLDGNATTTFSDDMADASLSTIAAPTLGDAPKLILVKEWRSRLWGVSESVPDELRFSQADAWWAWPVTNSINVPVLGDSPRGVTALMPRREFLGVGKRDLIWQVTGTTPSDFRMVKLTDATGVESQESVVIYQNTVWWLWKDGVYQWDAEGVKCISDGKVRSWFTTDDYFNRDRFQYSFAVLDQTHLKYRLFLSAADSTVNDRWIEYDIRNNTWWGPHKTDAFTPTCAFVLADANDQLVPVTGSQDAYVWQPQDTPTDHLVTGIDFNVLTKWHDGGGEPDYEKYWGELAILGRPQTTGVITVTPQVGYTNAAESATMPYSMSEGRQKLDRIGEGKLMRLRLQHDTYDEPVEIYGIEVNPVHIFGGR